MKSNGTGEGVLRKALAGSTSVERDKNTARMFLREHRVLLKLDAPDKELVLKAHWKDSLGRSHLRYSQMYKGLPVWPAELNVHLDAGGNVDLLNGAYVATPRKFIHKPVLT